MFSADVTTKQRIIAICLVRENSDALGHFSLLILSENFYLLGENKMNSFRIQNIKAFKDSGEIELKPITILVGKNSSGKLPVCRYILFSKIFTAPKGRTRGWSPSTVAT